PCNGSNDDEYCKSQGLECREGVCDCINGKWEADLRSCNIPHGEKCNYLFYAKKRMYNYWSDSHNYRCDFGLFCDYYKGRCQCSVSVWNGTECVENDLKVETTEEYTYYTEP
ncbi:unnamed protein product, partial [Brachionus calyciflorus]